VKQGGAEWLQERCGKATASRFSDVMAKVKVGEAATRRRYRMQLVTERLTGIPVEGYKNAAMVWGNEQEPFARIAFEATQGVIIKQSGFVAHQSIQNCGASPDGLIEEDGLLELKCPESTTHIEWMEGGKAPSEHIAQMQGQMAVTGRKYVQFASYDPRFPPSLQLFVVRVDRDPAYIEKLEKEVTAFLSEVDAMCERLLKRGVAK
jgi:putative phage-type endonuclease